MTFDINGTRLCVRGSALQPGDLSEFAAPVHETVDHTLTLCSDPHSMPNDTDQRYNGRHKCVAWQLAANGLSEIFFYASRFERYLFVRIVLLPLLKRIAVNQGGASFLGSAFEFNGRCVLLFGSPGSGKTTTALQAVKLGGQLIADNELWIQPSGQIVGLFDEIELRYKTARDSGVWDQLPSSQQRTLRRDALLGAVTMRAISLNSTVRPQDLGIRMVSGKAPDTVLCVGTHAAPTKQTVSTFAQAVSSYERTYHQRYCVLDCHHSSEGELRRNIERIFSSAQLWTVPSSMPVQDMIRLQDAE